ncbi:MAG: hypothetical protein ABI592_01350 [Acidobacteriota bacterium]
MARRSAVLLCVILLGGGLAAGDQFYVGVVGSGGLPIPDPGVQTYLQTGYPANHDGAVNEAGFWWSESPCPGAVKLKFFRPSGGRYIFLGQRGPFDVTVGQETVSLDPPMRLRKGDLIALTKLTECGSPVTAGQAAPAGVTPPPLPPYFRVDGDVVTDIVPSIPVPVTGPAVYVHAEDRGLALLHGRFVVFLSATNPRTNGTTSGYAVPLGDRAGYFSLPDFTEDPSFPEIVVKMVDATGSPSLGGGFWFFHAPLTDVDYLISVVDTQHSAVRTYTSSSGTPGLLCGGVDTGIPGP